MLLSSSLLALSSIITAGGPASGYPRASVSQSRLPSSPWCRDSGRPRRQVLRSRKWPSDPLGLSRQLRGLIALALVSLAASLVLRDWAGPWLMEVKGLSRLRRQ